MTPSEKARLELLGAFREEASERLNKINFAWISIEKDHTDARAAEELLRQLHTLKGESKMMGFSDMGVLAHRTEELVLVAKKRGFEVPPAFGDLVLAAVDGLGALLHKKAGSGDPGLDLSALLARFEQLLAELGGRRAEDQGKAAAPASGSARSAITTTQTLAQRGAALDAERFLRVDVDTIAAFSLAASEVAIAHAHYRHSVSLLKRLGVEVAGALARLEHEGDRAGHGDDARFLAVTTTTLRTVQTMLDATVDRLREQINEGSVHATELEHQVRTLRLVPIGPVFQRFARAVRDLASEHQKRVTITINDPGVTLDKIVIDRIADPLLHLIRNSVDHGLETPEERRQAGKSEEGTVTFGAEQQGGNAVIVVADDGRGVDRAAVKAKAIAVGLLTAEAAAAASDQELLGLLFLPGFSTRQITSETSGRGVGLDVVKHQVELLGGSVGIDSPPGAGTRFELRVPIRLALTRVLVVAAGGDLFAIPGAAVARVLMIAPSDIEMVNNRRAVRFANELIPVRGLTACLGLDENEPDQGKAIVLSHQGARVAMLVDECRNDVDVIAKPLGALLASTRLFSDACTLDEGDLALVLNPAELVGRVRNEARWARGAAATPRAPVVARRILFAEDSAITRAMVSRMLRALGYEVCEAEDGAQALALLEQQPVDLVLTDIDMPHVNGIELVERVRRKPEWRNLPVVVLTTHGSAEDKARAAAAGADAYMVKTEFSETSFRDLIASQLGA